MADNTAAGTMMRLSAKQLALMTERIKQRERTRIAEELAGYAVVEDAAGRAEAAESLREIARGLGAAVPDEPKPVALTPEQVREQAARLLVPGMETMPFMGYDVTDGDALPEARENADSEDIARMARRL